MLANIDTSYRCSCGAKASFYFFNDKNGKSYASCRRHLGSALEHFMRQPNMLYDSTTVQFMKVN